MNFVQQVDSNGCVVACIAMITGKPYNEIKMNDFPDWNNQSGGITADDRDKALVRNGIWPRRQVDNILNPGSLYTVSVASLNRKGGMHQVVVDCRFDMFKVYDPQMGNEGMEFYTVHTLLSFGDTVEVINVNELMEIEEA